MLTTTATELPRIMKCIGSRLMPATIPPEYDTQARDEGTAAHWLAQHLFEGGTAAAGSKAPNGWVVTDDMVEHVHTYLGALGTGGSMEVETTFAGETWEVRARADHVVYRDGVLTIDDFKYGFRPVSPVENWTLLAHAIGWTIRNGVTPATVVLRIHQPRPYHTDGPMRSWITHGPNVNKFHAAINARLSNPTDELTANLDQCAKCHARYDCPAFDRSAWNAMDVIMQAFSDTMPSEALAYEYETFQYAEQVIKTRREAVEELMTYRIKTGQVVPGYALQQRQGQRRWMPGLSGAALTAASGVPLVKDGLVTPAEAERRGVSKDVVASLTDRPLIGVKLERVDHDAIARRVFGER